MLHFHQFIIKSSKILSLSVIVFILLFIGFKYESAKIPERIESKQEGHSKVEDKIEPNYDVTLNNSLFKGLNKDLEPYNIRAERVVKTQEQKYKFNSVDADYLIDGANVLIKASAGLLDENTKWICLNDGAQISFNGYILESDDISINLHNKDSFSDSHSKVFFKHSAVEADSYYASDNNNVIKFKGHVGTRIKLEDF